MARSFQAQTRARGERHHVSRCWLLPQAFINFVCLLGWSPKDDRERLSRQELTDIFTLEGVNRSNATINFSDADPFDPKAVWLNAETIRTMPVDELTANLLPFVPGVTPERMRQITPLIQERIKLLKEVTTVADFFFNDALAPYDAAELIPQKAMPRWPRRCSKKRKKSWPPRPSTTTDSTRLSGLEQRPLKQKLVKCFSRSA